MRDDLLLLFLISTCLLEKAGYVLFPTTRYTRTTFIPAYHMDTELKSRVTWNLSTSLATVSQCVGNEYHPVIALYHILDSRTETLYQMVDAHQGRSSRFWIVVS